MGMNMAGDRKNQINNMIISAASIQDEAERSRKYRTIVGILSAEAIRSNDNWFLEEAVKTAGLVTDDPSKAYVDVIRAMAKISSNKKDEPMLKNALTLAGRISNDVELSVALHEMILAYAKWGVGENDEHILLCALDLIKKLPLDTYRSLALRNISRLLVKSNPGKALEFLEESIEIIENKENEPVYLASAFCEIANLLVALKDRRSYGFIKRSIALADDIADDFEKSAVLLKIVETGIAAGTALNDDSLVREAAIISEGISREYYKTLALNAVKK